MKNSTAKLLKSVANVIWVLGTIGSFMFYGNLTDIGYYFGNTFEGLASSILLVSLFNTFTSGLTFYALSVITETVHELKAMNVKQPNTEEVLTKF